MKWIRFVLFILPVLMGGAASAASGIVPVGQPASDFIYRQSWREYAMDTSRFDFQLGPYAIEKLNLFGTSYRQLEEIGSQQLLLFSSAGETYRAAKETRTLAFEALRGGVALRPADRLFVFGNFVLDEQRAKDPGYVGKKWRGLAGDVEQAFACWQTDRFDLTAGRFASFWGTPNSMVLGPDNPLDGFGYAYRWGRLTLSYRLARLDPFRYWKSDRVQVVENRYFAGHRLDLHVSQQLRIGIFETVVFGGEGRQLEFYYLNPLIFFHGSQVNEGNNDNTFVGLDFSLKPHQGLLLYGQLLIDDLQVEKQTQADQEPDEYGLLLGGYWANVAPSWDITAEYSRVTNWTFNQELPRNRYLYKGKLIGGALGSDYDLTDIGLTRWFGRLTAATIRFSYLRQGEGDPSADWTEPWMSANGGYRESFPTGVVESTTGLTLGVAGYFRSMFAYDCTVGLDRIVNSGHQPEANRTVPFIRVSLSAMLSTLVDMQ